jgi:hypothetical protein
MTEKQEEKIIRALSLLIAAVIYGDKKLELSQLIPEAESLRLKAYIENGQKTNFS